MAALVTARSHKLSTADGTLLHVSDFLLPRTDTRGAIVIMHGLGDHSGRYLQLAQGLNACGLSVRCYDQRGHGRAQGERGDVINGDPMLQDAQIVIDDFAAHFSEPLFLFGHSMGGLFAARFALAGLSPLRGLILSSPALAVQLSSTQRQLLKILHALAPRLRVPNGLRPKYLSHDAKVVAAYKADPLVHNKISSRLMRSVLSSMDYCHAHAATLALPTLMLVAGDDHLVDAEGSERFYAQLPAGIAKMHVYAGFYHEVLNETDAARPLADLRAWLGARLAG